MDGLRLSRGPGGRYLDSWEKRDGRWGLVRRSVVFDHQEVREVTAMPGHGLPAARDESDPSYSVLKGEQ